MARRNKKPLSGPNKAYLISFGDTMTALLAFFIVLNSLAEEQTGADLHAGTGSFIDALQNFGLPGAFPKNNSSHALQLNAPSPLYIVNQEEPFDPAPNPNGPDEEGDSIRVIDREAEDFQRFLYELERISRVEPKQQVSGEVAFDCFESLLQENGAPPPSLWQAAVQLRQIMSRPEYEVELTVWATTPSHSAWGRATEQSIALRERLVTRLHLTGDAALRLQATARPWMYSHIERPTASLIVRRLAME